MTDVVVENNVFGSICFNQPRFLASLLASALLILAVPGPIVLADSGSALVGNGFDVSYPQCARDQLGLGATAGSGNGTTAQFGLIGVTDGRALTLNPCLDRQTLGMVKQGLPISFYFNVNAPRSEQSSTAQTGPKGPCQVGNDGCAYYNYGWNTAQDAYSHAMQALANTREIPTAETWWLDVETANYWTPDQSLNDQVIQGAIDFLETATSTSTNDNGTVMNPFVVGIYSLPKMWSTIAGNAYQPGVPLWTVASTLVGSGYSPCSTSSFIGGPIWLLQGTSQGSDWDRAC